MLIARTPVTHPTVGKLRKEVTGKFTSEDERRTYITKHGTTAKMKIPNTGKTQVKTPPYPDHDTVTDDRPLFPGKEGTIRQFPNPDSVSVELDTGERKLITHRLNLNEEGLVEIYAPDSNKIDGRRGRIASVHSQTIEVWLRDIDTMAIQKHTLKYQQVTPLPLENELQLKQVCDRLNKLRECGLDPFEVQVLALYDQPVAFTPVELEYLAHIEQRHGITQGE